MRNTPEHPAIALTLRTGYPSAPPCAVCNCEKCGAAIREEEQYYEIKGEVYCPECIEGMKYYA